MKKILGLKMLDDAHSPEIISGQLIVMKIYLTLESPKSSRKWYIDEQFEAMDKKGD